MERPVLLVEDDFSTSEVLELLLSDDGYDVQRARDGGEALVAARENHFGLVLMDLTLPDLLGDQLIGVLQPYLGSTPVMVMSAACDGARRAQRARAVSFLPKPFEIDVLLQRMATLYRQPN